MPSPNELIAYGREADEVAAMIGADELIYQSLDDLVNAVKDENPSILGFETSVFDGNYVTKDIDQTYLESLETARSDSAKSKSTPNETGLELHNEEN